MAKWLDKIGDRLKRREGTPNNEPAVRVVAMMSYNRTSGGKLASKGFVSCTGLLVYNESTKETWGFHTYCPDKGFNKGQREKLEALGKEPGEKHAVLMHGDYYSSRNFEQLAETLTAELKKAMPGVHVGKPLKVTQRSRPPGGEYEPKWEFLYDAATGRMDITETTYPYADVPVLRGHHMLFEGVLPPVPSQATLKP